MLSFVPSPSLLLVGWCCIHIITLTRVILCLAVPWSYYYLCFPFIGTTIWATSIRGELVNGGVVNESLYRTILVMTTDYIGSKFTTFFPLIYTVFHLILFTNLIGMNPYTRWVSGVSALSCSFPVLPLLHWFKIPVVIWKYLQVISFYRWYSSVNHFSSLCYLYYWWYSRLFIIVVV